MRRQHTGYSDCHDIAVLPNNVAAGTVVPHTSDGRYGVLGSTLVYSRIDHAVFSQGRCTQNMDFSDWNARSDSLPQGQCSAKPLPVNPSSSSNADVRLCYVIPPSGPANLTNFLGESHEEALDACKARCTRLGGSCEGLNVVPMQAPPAVLYTDVLRPLDAGSSERAIPFGNSNCAQSCLDRETGWGGRSADAFICYPVKPMGDRQVEEDWTIAPLDTGDETWYSTVYKKDRLREFAGLTTSCTEYKSPEFPDGSSHPLFASPLVPTRG